MNESDSFAVRSLPDSTICKVRQIGAISGFANCLVEKPVECRFVLYFGEGNICRHPCWKDFLFPRPEAKPELDVIEESVE